MSGKFKGPQQYKPGFADASRPTTTLKEAMAKDLGFDSAPESEDSGSEGEMMSAVPASKSKPTIPLSDYSALQQQLESEREAKQKAVESTMLLKEELSKAKQETERRKDMLTQQKTLLENQHSKMISEREAAIKDLRDQVGMMKKQLAAAVVAAAPTDAPAAAAVSTVELDELKEKLQREIDTHTADVRRLEAELAVMRTASDDGASAKTDVLTGKIRQLESELAEQRSVREAAENKVATVATESETLRKELDGQKRRLEEELAALRSQLEILQSSGVEASSASEKAFARSKDLERQLSAATEAKLALEQQISTLEAAVAAAKADTQKEATQHASDVERLEAQLADLRLSGSEASAATAALRTEIDQWKTKHTEASSRLSETEQQVASLQAQKAKLENDLAAAQSAMQAGLAGQEEAQKASAAAIAAARATEEDLRAQIANLMKEKADGAASTAQLRAQLADSSSQLAQAQAGTATAAAEREQMRRRLEAAQSSSRNTARAVQQVAAVAHDARSVMLATRKDALDLRTLVTGEFRAVMAQMVQRLASVEGFLASSNERYKKESALRKKLHNQIIELRGNIRVFCRCRPLSRTETAAGDSMAVTFPGTEDAEIVLTDPETGKKRPYEFDRIYTPDSTQEMVFEDVEPLITSVLDGFNVCIFAYGQTGSGKTFTMEGPSDDPYSNPGVNIRALQRLYALLEERKQDFRYRIVVSVLEIYNENIHDLLADAKSDKDRKHEVKEGPQGVFVENLTEVEVSDMESVRRLFATGHSNRHVAETMMNADSSRSHLVLTVKTIGENLTTGQSSFGKLSLIDLAGSERVGKSGATGQQLKEASFINSSLSALGNTINALHMKQSHVPYRDSKLTRLLQDSLGGNSKTLMFVQVSPAGSNTSETQCSLQFATRVRKVELGSAKKNADSGETAQLRSQIRDLQAALTAAGLPLPATAAVAPAPAAAPSAAPAPRRR